MNFSKSAEKRWYYVGFGSFVSVWFTFINAYFWWRWPRTLLAKWRKYVVFRLLGCSRVAISRLTAFYQGISEPCQGHRHGTHWMHHSMCSVLFLYPYDRVILAEPSEAYLLQYTLSHRYDGVNEGWPLYREYFRWSYNLLLIYGADGEMEGHWGKRFVIHGGFWSLKELRWSGLSGETSIIMRP